MKKYDSFSKYRIQLCRSHSCVINLFLFEKKNYSDFLFLSSLSEYYCVRNKPLHKPNTQFILLYVDLQPLCWKLLFYSSVIFKSTQKFTSNYLFRILGYWNAFNWSLFKQNWYLYIIWIFLWKQNNHFYFGFVLNWNYSPTTTRLPDLAPMWVRLAHFGAKSSNRGFVTSFSPMFTHSTDLKNNTLSKKKKKYPNLDEF